MFSHDRNESEKIFFNVCSMVVDWNQRNDARIANELNPDLKELSPNQINQMEIILESRGGTNKTEVAAIIKAAKQFRRQYSPYWGPPD